MTSYVAHTVPDQRELFRVQGRDASPDGTFRRRLFEILEAVEAQSRAGLLRLRDEHGRVLGQLIVRKGHVCFAMYEGPARTGRLGRWRDVVRSCREKNQPLHEMLTSADAADIERLRQEARSDVVASIADIAIAMDRREVAFDFATLDNGYDSRLAFTPVSLLLEITGLYAPPCEPDAATAAFDNWVRDERTALLLREPDAPDGIAFAVGGSGLDGASLRDLIRLTRSVCEALRAPGPGQTPSYVVLVRSDLRWVCARGERHAIAFARRLDEPVEPALAAALPLIRR